MNDFDRVQSEKIECKGLKSRRNFLVKASVTSVVASLPVKTTWAGPNSGASVSGNLSGNVSSPQGDSGVSGKSPSEWAYMAPQKTWKNIFQKKCDGDYVMPGSNQWWTGKDENPTFQTILDGDNRYDRCLVSAYLNALYGYYPLTDTSDWGAMKYARDLEEEAHNNSYQRERVLSALESTWAY